MMRKDNVEKYVYITYTVDSHLYMNTPALAHSKNLTLSFSRPSLDPQSKISLSNRVFLVHLTINS